MHRPTVAAIAVVLWLGAAYFWRFPAAEDDPVAASLEGACVRLGIVMTALWLALPQLERYPVWILLVALIVVIVAVLAAKPRLLAVAVPILVVLWITRRSVPRSTRVTNRSV